MSPRENPFRAAEQVAPKIKTLVFGVSGVGKTYLALTAPGKIAAIDTEGGMAFYARRAGKGALSSFDVLQTKTYRDVQAAVQYIAANPTAYQTLVIDPVTVIYETLQDAALIKRSVRRNDPDADLEMLDWQRIKRSYKALMTELVNLPVHVIVVAREKDENEMRGKESVKVGVKPDAEKGTAYFFDTVIRLVPTEEGREAIVLKDRTGTHALNARIDNPTFDALFAAAIKAGRKDTGARAVQDDNEAAAIDAADTGPAIVPGVAGASSSVESATNPPTQLRPGLPRAEFLRLLGENGITTEEAQARAQELFGKMHDLTDVQRGELMRSLTAPTDAPSVPMFDPAEEAEIDAALANVR